MPTTTPEQFRHYLSEPEGTSLEFKTAQHRFDFDEITDYCVALANEGGGIIILGVTDRRPRTVTGTSAFDEPGRTEAGLHQRLHHRIPVEELTSEGHRVLLFHVPSRLPGCAWQYRGRFLKRAGDALTPLSDHELRDIFAETGPDFTAEWIPGATTADLDPSAIDEFRERVIRKSVNVRLRTHTAGQILNDSTLIDGNRINYAALILLGRAESIARYLPQAEVVFEYRASEAAGPAADREEYREPFLLYHDRLWAKISLRNDRQSYQQDFFRYDIPTFDETSVREAVLNAVCHRDYRAGGSVFIRQYARRLEIVSPGGFPTGITQENIADQQNPRNRRLAEALNRCGFIERSGQGVNLMIENAVRQTKPLPDFSGSSAHEVRLTLAGTVQNPAFIRFLERLGEEHLQNLSTLDFLALDALGRDAPLTPAMRERLPRLMEIGAVESQGRGRGARHFLSRELFAEMGSPGAYTRQRGLDHETNKELLLRHLDHNSPGGAPISELCQVLPACSRKVVQSLLQELRTENRIQLRGSRRGSRWHLPEDAGFK
ncbi:ATP-binding protein [Haloferula sargassicola]|uniref:Schlafen AlbA-2 domain-containing protein n=1 Tax=Haloferula sargassicola TaxID=490096 RepID=A0ABP9UI75_9BACT